MNMDIMWLVETDLTIVGDEDGIEDVQMVSTGDIDDVDILANKKDLVDLQFGDGSVAFNVKKEWFREME